MQKHRLGNRQFAIALAVIAGGGMLLRAVVAIATFPVGLQGDEVYYRGVATELALRGRHYSPALEAHSQWPPGNAAWLSLFIDAQQPTALSGPIAAQVALGSLLVVVSGLFAREVGGRRRACIAATLIALSPTLIAFSHYLWAATLLLVLLFGALWLALVAERRDSWAALFGAGLLFGLAGLTREVGLLVGVVTALWIASAAPPDGSRARATARAVLLVTVMAATVVPWTLRNLQIHERVVPVSTIGWMSMRIGNTLGPSNWWSRDRPALSAFHRRYFAQPSELARMDLARHESLQIVTAEQPAWLAKKLLRNTAHLLSLDDPTLAKIESGHYGAISPSAARVLVTLVSSFSIALFLGALIGVAGERNGRRAALLLGTACTIVALHVIANAGGRYRLPLLPIFAFYCSLALTTPIDRLRKLPRWRPVAALVVLIFYLFAALPFEGRHTVGALWQNGARTSNTLR